MHTEIVQSFRYYDCSILGLFLIFFTKMYIAGSVFNQSHKMIIFLFSLNSLNNDTIFCNVHTAVLIFYFFIPQ